MTATAMTTLMERYYQTYNSADPDALKAFYHPDVRLLSAQGELIGRDAIVDTYRYIIERFEDRMTPLSIIAGQDRVAVEIEDRFVARTAVAGFLGRDVAIGDQFTLNLCGVYRIDGAKICGVTLYAR